MARWPQLKSATRLRHSAEIRPRTLDGRRFRVASSRARRQLHVARAPGTLGYLEIRVATDWSQPPPKSSPGPSDARKIGRFSCLSSLRAATNNSWRAAPQVEEPR